MFNDKFTKHLIKAILVLLVILLLKQIPAIVTPILSLIGLFVIPFVVAVFFYYAFRPLVRFFKRRKMPDGLAVAFSLFSVILIFVIAGVAGGNVINQQFQASFTNNIDAYKNLAKTIEEPLRNLYSDFSINKTWFNSLSNGALSLTTNIFSIFSSLSSFGTKMILAFFFLFYLLKEDLTFKEFVVKKLLPKRFRKNEGEVSKELDHQLSCYINGQLIVALIIGCLTFIAYLIIGMPSALLMGFFAMITAIIPFVGPILGVLPALLLALTIDIILVVKVILVAIIVQQIEGNFVTPKVMGSKLDLHPIVVIIVVIFSMKIMGILGAFIGIPAFLVAKTLFEHYRKTHPSKELEKS